MQVLKHWDKILQHFNDGVTPEQIKTWCEDNKDFLPLEDTYTCTFEVGEDNASIDVSGDEDLTHFDIEQVEPAL